VSAPEPRSNPLLRGHEAAEALVAEALRGGRFHHAWLITGPPGIGKATFAYRFARRLLAGAGEGGSLFLPAEHPVFRRVAVGSHADLLTVEREINVKTKRMRTEIVVENAREIPQFMHRTPAAGGGRVVVVDGAEDLNRSAANALLKVLEEPPARAVLLLTCSAPGRLLPTIRSRCRRLALAPLDEMAMADVLGVYLPELEGDARGRVITLAEGSVGRALDLAGSGGVAMADLVGLVLAAVPDLPVMRAHEVADKIGRDEDAFSTFMDLLRAGLAAAVRDAARGRADPDQSRLLGTRPLDAWVDVWHALTRLQDETEGAHLDKRQALVEGFALLAGKSPGFP
jgi:DNA polymerase-3 subunit delta'